MDDIPAGQALLDLLRGAGLARPFVDPDVDGYLRDEMGRAVADVGHVPPEVVVRISKKRVREVLLCEQHLVASLEPEGGALSLELVVGLLLDRLFSLVVIGHPVGGDPFGTAVRAAAVAGDVQAVEGLEALPPDDRLEVEERVGTIGRLLADRWPALPPNAYPRLQEPLRAELAGGRVVLSGRVDLALGRPTLDRAGTTLVDVKSGKRRYDDALDADWYAVLEALRHRAPPFQSGSYYLRDGGLDMAVFDAPRLERAAARVADGVSRLVRLAAGEPPTVTPNGLCAWCPALATCGPGRAHAAEQGYDAIAWDDDDS